MNDQKEEVSNVYKTSKTTWFLIAFMAIILIIIVFMMTRKKKDGEGGISESISGVGASMGSGIV